MQSYKRFNNTPPENNMEKLKRLKSMHDNGSLDKAKEVEVGEYGQDFFWVPKECWLIVLMLLDVHDLGRMMRVSRYHYHLAKYILEEKANFNVIEGCVPTREQQEVMDAVRKGQSIYLGGEAGAGKSRAMMFIKTMLNAMGKYYKVCGSTAQAASLLGGTTLHSTFCMGDAGFTPQQFEMDVRRRARRLPPIQTLEVLILDEISMVSGRILDLADFIARMTTEKPDSPFGGIQVIFVGDFLQLPPIDRADLVHPNKSLQPTTTSGYGRGNNFNNSSSPQRNVKGQFAFKSKVWNELFLKEGAGGAMFFLKSNFRQSGDNHFKTLLSSVRRGNISDQVDEILRSRLFGAQEVERRCLNIHSKPVKLFSTNKRVNEENKKMFDQLRSPTYKYGVVVEGDANSFPKSNIPQDLLELKVGTRVAVTKNHFNYNTRKFHHNGQCGTVKGFTENPPPGELVFHHVPLVVFDDDDEDEEGTPITSLCWEQKRRNDKNQRETVVGRKFQLPLTQAWSLTIHRCQGMTLENVITDLSELFEDGMGYVALSRVHRLEDLFLLGYQRNKLTASDEAYNFYFQHFIRRKNIAYTTTTSTTTSTTTTSSSSSSSHK